MSAPVKLAYLTGRYPAVSHTFVLSEVQALRRLGVEVETLSIHRASSEHLLARAEREEFERTYAVLPPRWGELIRTHATAFLRKPKRYLSTLGLALRLARPGLRGRVWQLFYFVEAIAVWNRCRQQGVRHVHAQFANQATDAAMLAAHYGGQRSGWTWSLAVHGPMEFYDVPGNRLVEKVRRALFVVCISDFCRSQLMAHVEEEHWPKLHIVHCGVELDRYMPRPGAGSGAGGFHILGVGRLVRLKGPHLLIRAVAELERRGIDVSATLIGDGPDRVSLERLVHQLGIADRVEIAGSIGQDEIRDRYAAADVFCLPSFGEGVPVVLMEAMAMEIPVVTTSVHGIPELVEDGSSGFVVRPGRLDQLVRALETLAHDPELRGELGRAGREKVAAEYDVHRSAVALRQIYEHALGDGAGHLEPAPAHPDLVPPASDPAPVREPAR